LGCQARIAGNPPQAGILSIVFFEDGSGIHTHHMLECLVSQLGNFLREKLYGIFKHLVVIG
jgi:cell division inhibitor SulA